MSEQEQHDDIPESKAAKWASRLAWIPIAGLPLYMLFAFIAMLSIGLKGRLGFRFLKRGLIICLFINLVPVGGFMYFNNPLTWYGYYERNGTFRHFSKTCLVEFRENKEVIGIVKISIEESTNKNFDYKIVILSSKYDKSREENFSVENGFLGITINQERGSPKFLERVYNPITLIKLIWSEYKYNSDPQNKDKIPIW